MSEEDEMTLRAMSVGVAALSLPGAENTNGELFMRAKEIEDYIVSGKVS